MTAIAAFKKHGHPALVADMLMSRPDGRNQWPKLGTNPEAYATLGELSASSFGGLKRKLLIVNPQLAVAWAGSEYWAESVFYVLDHQFRSKVPTEEDLLRALQVASVPKDVGSEVVLIGWLLRDRPLCFRWSSMAPSNLESGDSHFDGSGKAIIEASMIGGETLIASGSSALDARRGVASAVATLVCEELEFGKSLQSLFGFAFDMVTELQGRFEYLPSTLFAYFHIECTKDRRVTSLAMPRRMLKWFNHNDLAAVQISQLSKSAQSLDEPTEIYDEEGRNVLVAPTLPIRCDLAPPPGDMHILEAEWLAVNCAVSSPGRSAGVTIVLDAQGSGAFRIAAYGDGLGWDVHSEELDKLVRHALHLPLLLDLLFRARNLVSRILGRGPVKWVPRIANDPSGRGYEARPR